MQANEIIRDRYELLRPLGAGGFGEVWLAKDMKTHTQCALKFYVRLDDKGREEFSSEYSRMLGIHHSNLLTASYYDEWQGRPFLVMDYCGGGAASGKVGQLGETELWRLIRDVASGLACLHSQRDARGKEVPVIHQDIKPANFLQKGDGTWLISDFGISSRMRSSMSSQSGREVSSGGTIPYMGPERFGQNQDLVKASDIWSLGASIYEMAKGKVPFGEFGGGTQRAGAEIPHLPGERWSSDLDRLVSSCLQKETWDRPTAELVAEYADCKLNCKPLPRLPKETPPPLPNPIPISNPKPDPKPDPKPKLWKWMAAAGAVVAVVLAIVLWPEPKPPVDSDTEAYEACRTVADYRAYMRDYGRNALHYAEAKKFVDDHVADSTDQAQQQLAQQQAQQQAEADAKAQAEAERKEETAYGKCTTVSGCNSYLKTYPNGKYVEEVKAKKAELEAEAEVERIELHEMSTNSRPAVYYSDNTIYVDGRAVYKLIHVSSGAFYMGAQDDNPNGLNYDVEAYSDESPAHSVTLSSYYVGETEVTQELWKVVMGNNPSYFKGESNLPMENVSYEDIVYKFIPKLSQLTGKKFRLPTEAEWEFAARGGNDSKGYKYSGANILKDVAWYNDNAGGRTHPVKQKQANELGLYDMSGNVWEWCSDWYDDYTSDSQRNPVGPSTGHVRVLRGCGWDYMDSYCRVSSRCYFGKGGRWHPMYCGFRLVLSE